MASTLPVLAKGNGRVMLRPMTEADQPILRSFMVESPELRRLIDNPSIPTEEDQMNWFKRCQEPDRAMFAVEMLEKGYVIGTAGFVDIGEAQAPQLRITIADAYQGQGLGKEAMFLLLQYAFTVLKWNSVWLRVLPENERAIGLYQKCGFAVVPSEPEDKGKIRMKLTQEDYHAIV